ncbi:unnamed protein product, partial [Prunus brigantina]
QTKPRTTTSNPTNPDPQNPSPPYEFLLSPHAIFFFLHPQNRKQALKALKFILRLLTKRA